ncbi:hypothetical protein BDP81DRAFT_432864 [Colletotrichum phormii]|uniref:Uncharacterized protein n=1 Tax=Colletotrichum phormii TaxID=359342 RepID=A0AAI9ZM14_9PEZI|nr:uncharacterized protein BDP81DRAFT_432864 [Colletotrichum phormii]KAK1634460.1 hypothetical protein BDP81DRAFT_432864 [Colletotrichum phormii]
MFRRWPSWSFPEKVSPSYCRVEQNGCCYWCCSQRKAKRLLPDLTELALSLLALAVDAIPKCDSSIGIFLEPCHLDQS